jgi:hypothetical protein
MVVLRGRPALRMAGDERLRLIHDVEPAPGERD